MDKDYLQELFINEAKVVLKRHSGGSGGGSGGDIRPLTITKPGTYDATKGVTINLTEVKLKEHLDPEQIYAVITEKAGTSEWEQVEIGPLGGIINGGLYGMSGTAVVLVFRDTSTVVYSYGELMPMITEGAMSAYTGWVDMEAMQPIDPPTVKVMDNAVLTPAEMDELFYSEPATQSFVADGFNPVDVKLVGATIKTIISLRNGNADSIFGGANSVTSYEGILSYDDTSEAVSMCGFFASNHSLEQAPLIDTRKVTDINSVFNECTNLRVIPEWDLRSVVHDIYISTYQYGDNWELIPGRLQKVLFKNIRVNLRIYNDSAYYGGLTKASIMNLIYEYHDVGSLLTLTVGTLSLNSVADTYIKVVDITDEMRAKDDLIDAKLPFVECESTDEGAMLIEEYAVLKNLEIQ